MVRITQPKRRSIFGMTSFQIGIRILLLLSLSAILCFFSYIIINNTSPMEVISFIGITDPSRAIIGKWEIYKKPTPTFNLELTQTHLAEPTPTPVTPIPLETYLAQGNPWGYSYIASTPIVININCAFGYSTNIEFFSDGTYAGPALVFWSSLFLWQGGQYEILDDNRIKMQTQNGFAVYNFIINKDTLTFIDDNDCEIRYQRSK